MKWPIILAAAAIASLGACGGTPPEALSIAAPPTEFLTVGTFNSFDANAGTVNISHQPVPAAGWPAMTMDFKLANPEQATELEPGDRVDLHFTIESGMNATITHLEAIR